ncbi:MAG: hydroxyethylthiazole kinase [Peptococcaceae bacterium]|nr:hydroxyethylthiazole kinase [Peptococcaceae bacterium]MDH7526209.1 hydroxyethylthiazole kinase [Peptococcaceae bacterium]
MGWNTQEYKEKGGSAMTEGLLWKVREMKPLVHHITNNVTVGDCASITLSMGGLPVMAYAAEEVGQMAAAAGALVLNIGTLSLPQVEAMLIAGKTANELGIPVVLDPVGVGATDLRTRSAERILAEVKLAVLKGNKAEISILAGAGGKIRGVESVGEYENMERVARSLALRENCVVAVTGREDLVTDGRRVALVANGHPLMGAVVGTGCMAASVIGCFCGIEKDAFSACVDALAAFGLAGEIAARAPHIKGPGTFKAALFDAAAGLSQQQLDEGRKTRVLS